MAGAVDHSFMAVNSVRRRHRTNIQYIYIYTLGVKDYKKYGLTRGPERELPLLQPVKI